MNKRMTEIRWLLTTALACVAIQSVAFAQGIMENFNTVVGGPPTIVLDGSGFARVDDWDAGIVGESAFAGTTGNITTLIRAYGLTAGGVGGSGAGAIDFEVGSFNVIDQSFNNVAGTGGGEFLAGGAGPDTFNFASWDDNLTNEFAFGGTFGGAVLDGNMSAQGVLAGGNPGGFAQLDVNGVTLNGGNWYTGLQFDIGAFPGAGALADGGFENDSPGVPPTTWSHFGSGTFIETVTPRTGAQDLKLYEFLAGNGAGVYQDLPAEPGQVWELDAFLRTNTGDSIAGKSSYVILKIEYRTDNDTLLAESELSVIGGTDPENQWIDATPLQAVAPPNTTIVRPLIVYVYPGGTVGNVGAVYVDDVTFNLVSGPQPVTLDAFALTADVRGTANAAGETLGDIQLRIEDNDGNRIQFNAAGTSGWQSLGGPLNTGVEADSTGTPTPGAFNLLSPNYRVVVAMNNESGNPWGTGGTLDLDNLVLTNQNPAGSGFNAAMVFDQIMINESNPDLVSMTADIFGDTAGGEYQLKITALDVFDTGLDEDFESVVDTTEIVFLDTATIDATQPNAFSSVLGWSPDLDGEQAFAGIAGLVDTVSFSPRAYARGIDTAGCGGSTHAGELVIESVSTSGAWYGGLNWPGQKLASADFSQVELHACVRGIGDPSDPFGFGFPGLLGNYELRIEDADGDRLYFPVTADASWQQVGGLLSAATFGTALDGVSNGIFDIDPQDPDSLDYAVVVAFTDEASTWFSGGQLQVDDLFLTPVQASVTVADFTFNGVADGSTFQTIGGVLTSADGPGGLGNFDEDIESATGTPGGTPMPASVPFDDGLENEFAFFGTYGNAVINGGAAVGVCGSCGVDGSKAIELTITDVPPNTGGWFSGVFFADLPADLSGDLSQIFLTGDIKGEANGGVLGPYELRIEDADKTALTFSVTADGTFQSVGGPLSTAAVTNADPGTSNGTFDVNQTAYNVTIAFLGTSSGSNWGPGGKLTIDNLFLTGRDLSSVDQYEVTLSFVNELTSWPNGAGQLIIDNLNVLEGAPATPGDVNCDGDINGLDVQAFATAIVDPAGYATAYPGCNILNADTNSDSSATVADVATFVALLVGP